jgi:hypothetical protein
LIESPENVTNFQGDIFNVSNHPSFGPETATLNSSQFGVTGSMANTALGSAGGSGTGFNPIFQTGAPRNLQFSLKLFLRNSSMLAACPWADFPTQAAIA